MFCVVFYIDLFKSNPKTLVNLQIGKKRKLENAPQYDI
jgi:hypothetical protein